MQSNSVESVIHKICIFPLKCIYFEVKLSLLSCHPPNHASIGLYKFDNQTCSFSFHHITGNYSCLAAKFRLHRSIGFHLVQSYVPTILIVIVSWVSFWMDVEHVPVRHDSCLFLAKSGALWMAMSVLRVFIEYTLRILWAFFENSLSILWAFFEHSFSICLAFFKHSLRKLVLSCLTLILVIPGPCGARGDNPPHHLQQVSWTQLRDSASQLCKGEKVGETFV